MGIACSVSGQRSQPFLWLWFTLWTVGGGFAWVKLYEMLLSGPEVVTIGGGAIAVQRNVWPWASTRRWELGSLSEMRVKGYARKGGRVYAIVFFHCGKRLTLLPSSDRGSTERLLAEMRAHFGSSSPAGLFAEYSEAEL